jgi:UDP-glucose 4-epimerase
MKVLVTGGAGFIGSHIAESLLERGDSVRVIDNFTTGKRENIDALSRKFGEGMLELVAGDIRDASRMAQAVAGVELVFHSAAFVSVPGSMEVPQGGRQARGGRFERGSLR